MSKHCSALTSLNLSSCAKIGDGAICDICRSITQLVELDLSYLKLGDLPLLQLADSCTLLRKLSLECCWNVGNAGVCAVAAACTSLEALVLSGCAKLSDVALCSLGQHSTLLRRLALNNLVRLTDEGVCSVAERCVALRHVSLGGCRKLGDVAVGVNGVSGYCAALEYIDLEQCTALTDAGIHALLAGCRRLSIMRLSGCDNVSASAVALVQSMGLKTQIGQHDEIVLDYLSLLRAR